MTDSLLSRLQSLTEPSREIDAEIALANGWEFHESKIAWKYHWRNADGELANEPPHYTKSLDAALMRLPERARWRVGDWFNAYADLTLPSGVKLRADAATPAIALCIVFEKAKQETK